MTLTGALLMAVEKPEHLCENMMGTERIRRSGREQFSTLKKPLDWNLTGALLI